MRPAVADPYFSVAVGVSPRREGERRPGGAAVPFDVVQPSSIHQVGAAGDLSGGRYDIGP